MRQKPIFVQVQARERIFHKSLSYFVGSKTHTVTLIQTVRIGANQSIEFRQDENKNSKEENHEFE